MVGLETHDDVLVPALDGLVPALVPVLVLALALVLVLILALVPDPTLQEGVGTMGCVMGRVGLALALVLALKKCD